MKKIFGLTIGGLQQKIINLILTTILLTVAVFMLISNYQNKMLSSIVQEAQTEQQQSITGISDEIMFEVLRQSFVRTTRMQADMADNDFAEVAKDVYMLQTIAEELFQNRNTIARSSVDLPDASKDGEITSMVLFEEGVDYTASQYLGVAAHMVSPMKAMLSNSDKISRCYIGLADGTHIAVDTSSANKYDENGRIIPFPVRQRPWYTAAQQAGEMIFTGLEKDAYTGEVGVTCAVPVTVGDEFIGVVAVDLVLENMSDFVRSAADSGSYAFIINNRGQVILSPEDNGTFRAEEAETADDLRESEDPDLARFVTAALQEPTDLTLLTLNDRQYYVAGAPMPTIGWAVIGVVDKEVTEQPGNVLSEGFTAVNTAAAEKFRAGTAGTNRNAMLMIMLLMLVSGTGGLYMANRIVKPVKAMTEEITNSSKTGQVFEMKDVYRTSDEIELLAESFDDLSRKTVQYINDITEITKEKERIGTELELARKIQADMLPNIYPAFPERSEFDIYATMDPAKEVGGDFYDFFLIDNDHLGMVIADVSGKGVPAALFMMMSKILINNYSMMGGSPARILEKINDTICQNNEEEMFLTVWLGILEISTGRITAANAGHEYPAICGADGKFELLKDRHGFVIGGIEGVKYTDYEMTLEKGGMLFLYTDGVPEAMNEEHELFGAERMIEAMNSSSAEGPVELLTDVTHALDAFVGDAAQFDDVTMLGLKLL